MWTRRQRRRGSNEHILDSDGGVVFHHRCGILCSKSHDLILFIGSIECGALVLYGAATMQSRNDVQT